jgi:hypothetical protein
MIESLKLVERIQFRVADIVLGPKHRLDGVCGSLDHGTDILKGPLCGPEAPRAEQLTES